MRFIRQRTSSSTGSVPAQSDEQSALGKRARFIRLIKKPSSIFSRNDDGSSQRSESLSPVTTRTQRDIPIRNHQMPDEDYRFVLVDNSNQNSADSLLTTATDEMHAAFARLNITISELDGNNKTDPSRRVSAVESLGAIYPSSNDPQDISVPDHVVHTWIKRKSEEPTSRYYQHGTEISLEGSRPSAGDYCDLLSAAVSQITLIRDPKQAQGLINGSKSKYSDENNPVVMCYPKTCGDAHNGLGGSSLVEHNFEEFKAEQREKIKTLLTTLYTQTDIKTMEDLDTIDNYKETIAGLEQLLRQTLNKTREFLFS